MPEMLPLDVREFVDGAIASGEYGSEQELVISAVRMLQKLTADHAVLSRDIADGVAQADHGDCQLLNMEAIKEQLQEEWRSKRAA